MMQVLFLHLSLVLQLEIPSSLKFLYNSFTFDFISYTFISCLGRMSPVNLPKYSVFPSSLQCFKCEMDKMSSEVKNQYQTNEIID